MKTIVEAIVIEKLFLDNEIIALIKISDVTTHNNIHFLFTQNFTIIKNKKKIKKHVLKKIDIENQIINLLTFSSYLQVMNN